MGNIFKTRPSLSLYLNFYRVDSLHKRPERLPSYFIKTEETKYFCNYYRDVSGIIKLNTNNCNYRFKYYAILQVVQEVFFIDQETLDDYNRCKRNFIRLNRDEYEKYNFSEY